MGESADFKMTSQGQFLCDIQTYLHCILVSCVLFLLLTNSSSASVTEDLIQVFASRSQADWVDSWHTDCHRRCRVELVQHIRVACAFDIYKSRKKRDISSNSTNSTNTDSTNTGVYISQANTSPQDNKSNPLKHKSNLPFISRSEAAAFLSTMVPKPLSRKKRGIMEECCYTKPCSWEEYAETCHHYSRRPAQRSNHCFK